MVTLEYIALGLGIVSLGCSIIAAWLTLSIHRTISSITKGTNVPRLDRLIADLLTHLHSSKRQQGELQQLIESLRQDGLTHLQHVGFVRFNPFSDTGGDQSFALVLLDGHHNGIVISSLHARDETRLFVKPIRNGKPSGYEFSAEEQRAIHEALKQ